MVGATVSCFAEVVPFTVETLTVSIFVIGSFDVSRRPCGLSAGKTVEALPPAPFFVPATASCFALACSLNADSLAVSAFVVEAFDISTEGC